MGKAQRDFLIIGAGISGLSAAFWLKKKGHSVLVLEAKERAGGSMRSFQKGDYLLELGPNTVRPTAELMTLIKDLGLSNRYLLAPSTAPRFIWNGRKLSRVPLSPSALLFSDALSFKGKCRLFKEPWIKSKGAPEETLAGFIGRRFGEEVSESLLKPFVSGVWAGDADKLSASAAFPALTRLEEEYGSILKGLIKKPKSKNGRGAPKGLLSFPGGLQEIVNALTASLGNDLVFNQPVERLNPTPDGTWSINGFEAKKIILCLPAGPTAKLVAPFHEPAARALEKIPYPSLTVVFASVSKNKIFPQPEGFGFLVQPKVSQGVLGGLFPSNLFPGRAPQDRILMTFFIGGSHFSQTSGLSQNDLEGMVRRQLQGPFTGSMDLKIHHTVHYPKAIPQYHQGHDSLTRAIKMAEKDLKTVRFGSNFLEGISVGDVVKQARKIAEEEGR